MTSAPEFFEDFKKSVQTSLASAGYHAVYQSPQKWPAAFHVSSGSSQGSVTLFFGRVCEKCGETLPYRVINSQGAFGGRVTIPRECDAATAADCLMREVLPLLTNRLPAVRRHNPGVGGGLLSPQKAGRLAEAIKSRSGSH